MNSLKSILPVAVSFFVCIEANVSRAQSQPQFSVSTNYVASGQHVYLIGKNLGAGLQVNVYDDSSSIGPRFVFTADQNGEINGDITDPNTYNSAQRYRVVYATSQYFFVKYADGNPYRWASVITGYAFSRQNGSTNRTVILKADVTQRNAYQPQYAPSLNGPWTPVGKSIPGNLQGANNATWTFEVPDDSSAKFFRIWNPQGY